MKRRKIYPIIAMFVLLLQLLMPISETVANATLPTQTMQSDDYEKIEVKKLDQNEESIKWRVSINPSGEENEGVDTEVTFGQGLTHGTFDHVSDVDMTKTDVGYVIKTPAGRQKYVVELTTRITDPDQKEYTVQAVATYAEGTFTASDTASSDEVAPSNNDHNTTDDASEARSAESGEATEDHASERHRETSKEAMKEAGSGANSDHSSEDAGEEASVKPEKKANEKQEIHPLFLPSSRGQALSSRVTSDPVWPNPGALNLEKEAVSTGKYAEWEITLKVDGKNIEKSSDVVLVFDKSNSMNRGSRLPKAKAAAKEFVDNLLTENSATRIGVVTFSEYHDMLADFTSFSGKDDLKNKIDGILASGGTNMQAGLHQAQMMLESSTADRKVIVLLSDGAPTYSYKASQAAAYTWPNNKYNFVLSDFDYNRRIGDGSVYKLSEPTCVPFFGCFGGEQYKVNGYTVKTNGIATLSEAKAIMNAGTTIYSIGLEVGGDDDARYVLENSQNGGTYIGGEDDLSPAFEEIVSEVRYAAKDAVVTDPMGDMFDLVMQGATISPNDYAASQGTVDWDPATETFTWHVGNVVEGTPATLTYKVKMDFSKNPEGGTLYPTNGETPINYEDANGERATKYFPIPRVSLDRGSILMKGYLVNMDGKPINQNGEIVPSPQLAYQFYSDYFEENGSPALLFDRTYSVPAKDVPDHTLIVGDNPTIVHLETTHPSVVVWFGYVKSTDIEAGDVTALYVDEDGNRIADDEVYSGRIGDSYTTERKNIPGYVFKEMGEGSAPATGVFKAEAQTVIYVYAKRLGSVTVIKVDAEDEITRLSGATFELYDADDHFVGSKTTDENGLLVFEALEGGDYYLVETKAPTGYRLLTGRITLSIGQDDWHVTKTVKNTKTDWEIPKTGGIGTLGFYGLGILLMAVALWYLFKKRKA